MSKIRRDDDSRNFLRSMKEEWNPDRSLPSQSYSFITPELPKDFMDECMEIVEKLDKRQTKTDVVNWKERAEMDAVTKRSGKYLTVDEDETYTDVMPTKEEREARKSSKKPSAINEETRRPAAPKVQVSKQEQNLMDYLGGVMDLLGDK